MNIKQKLTTWRYKITNNDPYIEAWLLFFALAIPLCVGLFITLWRM